MITDNKHTPKSRNRKNQADLVMKRSRFDKASRTPLVKLIEIHDDLAERREHRLLIAAHFEPSVHEVTVVTQRRFTGYA